MSIHRRNKRHLASLVVAAVALLGVNASSAAGPSEENVSQGDISPAATSQVSYVVSPHPDDDFQGWSLVENSPLNYKSSLFLHMESKQTIASQNHTLVPISQDWSDLPCPLRRGDGRLNVERLEGRLR